MTSTTKRLAGTALAACVALSAFAASANEYNKNNYYRGHSDVSCNGFADNSTSRVIHRGGANARTSIGDPIANNSCYPSFGANSYSPRYDNMRYDSNGNLVRTDRAYN